MSKNEVKINLKERVEVVLIKDNAFNEKIQR